MKPQAGGAVPFANATEGDAWETVWCAHCRHDHCFHPDGDGDGGCELMLAALLDPDRLPEGWLDVPEGYGFHMPSHMLCTRFEPCTQGGCSGDPMAEQRENVVTNVMAAWAGVS